MHDQSAARRGTPIAAARGGRPTSESGIVRGRCSGRIHRVTEDQPFGDDPSTRTRARQTVPLNPLQAGAEWLSGGGKSQLSTGLASSWSCMAIATE